MNSCSRREWLLLNAVGFTSASISSLQASTSSAQTSFHYDHLLGTSLDVSLVGCSETQLEQAEQSTLAEVERLRRVFSTYDPQSELSRWNASTERVVLSAEMVEILNHYKNWMVRTRGALNPQVGTLVKRWQLAELDGQLPDPHELVQLAESIQIPAWQMDFVLTERDTRT
jgi:FAD:protein FMN transferase